MVVLTGILTGILTVDSTVDLRLDRPGQWLVSITVSLPCHEVTKWGAIAIIK